MINKWIQAIREHAWLSLSAAGAVLFAYAAFSGLMPEAREVIEIFGDVRRARTRIESVKDFEAKIPTLEKKEKRLRDETSRLAASTGSGAGASRILASLAATAKEKGLRLVSVKPLEAVTAKGHAEFPLQVTITGRYHELGKFANAIESGWPVMRIREARTEPDEGNSNRIRAELSIVVYVPSEAK